MALTRFSGDDYIIRDLSDQPNDNDGLSADELKAKFDQFGSTLKEYLNGILIPELEAAINDAASGISTQGISGASIRDKTITAEKLRDTNGSEAVKTDVIRDGAVTTEKLHSDIRALLGTINGKAVITQTSTTLSSGYTEWTQTVSGVEDDNAIIPAAGIDADDVSFAAWNNCGIHVVSQSHNTLVFKARTAPASDVVVNILIID